MASNAICGKLLVKLWVKLVRQPVDIKLITFLGCAHRLRHQLHVYLHRCYPPTLTPISPTQSKWITSLQERERF